jgi:hypothetical protein
MGGDAIVFLTGRGLIRHCSIRMKTTDLERMGGGLIFLGGGLIFFILTSLLLVLLYISLKPMK